jgi:hypothetical protein
VTSITPGSGQNIVIPGFTLPSGATGVNVYAIAGSAGTLKKQGSMSVSGGVASNYTMSSYNSSGASEPSVNPPAAAYPVSITWPSTLSTPAIKITSMNNFTIENLMLYGNSNSTAGVFGIGLFNCSGATLGTGLVLSSFYGNLVGLTSQSYITGCQSDHATVDYWLINKSCCNQLTSCIAIAGAYGFYCQEMSNFWSTNVVTNSYVQIAANKQTSYNFAAILMSLMDTSTVSTGGQQAWDTSGTTYNPAQNTTGAENSYMYYGG